MSRTRVALAAAASAALVVSVAPSADAAKGSFRDERGDLAGGHDIARVQVKNQKKQIKIRSVHRNLRYGQKPPSGSVAYYIDTIRKRKGPEFRIAGPVGFDGDYALVKMRGWKKVVTDGPGIPCRLSFKVNYKRDAVRASVRTGCLGKAFGGRPVGKIRVSAEATQFRKRPGVGRDWAPKRHRFYRPVRRG